MELAFSNGTGEAFPEISEIPLWVLVCYYVLVSCGVCVNVAVGFVLFRSKRNGVLSSILQMAAVDLVMTYVAILETWTLTHHTWIFPTRLCPVYISSEALYSTLILYLNICVNFHIISTVNLYLDQMEKDNKNPLTSYTDDDSEECLVPKTDTQVHRMVLIDYRREKTDLSILLPSASVWFVCLSLSAPQYVLSNAVSIDSDYVLCTIVDVRHKQLVRYLSRIFRVAVPLPLLLISLLALVKKMYDCKYSAKLPQNVLTEKSQRVQSLLTLGTSLTFLYIAASVQRQFLYFLDSQQAGTNLNSFKMAPLENAAYSRFANLVSSMIHYTGGLLRGMLYISILPQIRCSLKRLLCRYQTK